MTWISVQHAHEYWKSQKACPDLPDLEQVEVFILSMRPQTAQDVACMIEVILAYGGDGRCDGLDVEALGRIHHFLQAA